MPALDLIRPSVTAMPASLNYRRIYVASDSSRRIRMM